MITFVVMNRKPKKAVNVGISTQPLINVDPNLSSFDGHPFFEKKAAKAKATLKRVGLPKELSRKKSNS
jgi:hypothetical protein